MFCQMMEVLNEVTLSSHGGGVSWGGHLTPAALGGAHGQSLRVASRRRVILAHDR